MIIEVHKKSYPKNFRLYSPTVVDGDNEGIVFKIDGDRDTISSLGGHNTIQELLSVITACPSSHSYFLSAQTTLITNAKPNTT